MIRPATLSDIPAVMEMGRRFADEAGVTEKVGWDDASVEALLTSMIENDNGILLLGEKSMIGGLVYPHPFNSSCVVFQELFWRSEGLEGRRLLDAAHKQAEALGATHSAMMAIEGMEPERTAKIYRRLGYEPFDRTFIRKL
jgi:GNAT superfamily N-acetyltransferase